MNKKEEKYPEGHRQIIEKGMSNKAYLEFQDSFDDLVSLKLAVSVKKGINKAIKLCSEAHKKDIEALKKKFMGRDSCKASGGEFGECDDRGCEYCQYLESNMLKKQIQTMTESIDKLIEKIHDLNHFRVADVGTIKVHHAEKYILIDKEELEERLKSLKGGKA